MFLNRLVLKKFFFCLLLSAFLVSSSYGKKQLGITRKTFLASCIVGGFAVTIVSLNSLGVSWSAPGWVAGTVATMLALYGLFSYVDETEKDGLDEPQFYYDSNPEEPYSWDYDPTIDQLESASQLEDSSIGQISDGRKEKEKNKNVCPIV